MFNSYDIFITICQSPDDRIKNGTQKGDNLSIFLINDDNPTLEVLPHSIPNSSGRCITEFEKRKRIEHGLMLEKSHGKQ
jgi:hypothetical protein